MPIRKLIVSLLALPLLLVGTLVYAQTVNWVDPTGAPPNSPIPGITWLFGSGNQDGQRLTGSIWVSGEINTSGPVTGASGEFSGGLGTVALSTMATASGSSALLAQQATGAFAGNFVGLVRIDNDSASGVAGCIRYNGTTGALEYTNDCSAPTPTWVPFGGSSGSSTSLWSLEGTGPNVYKGVAATPATLGGVVAIGTATPATGGFPSGTRLALVGEGSNGPRIFIDSATGNPEIDLEIGTTPGSHWGIYVDKAAIPPTPPTNDLRFWQGKDILAIADSGNVGIGDDSVANPLSTLDVDGVITFRGWGPPVPTINGINPSSGNQGQTVDSVITGTNLSGATSVTFSGSGVTAVTLAGGSANSLPIRITILGTAAAGNRTFTVVTPAGSTGSGTVTFGVSVPPPTITQIAPPSGVQGATNLAATITGANLLNATSVTFSGTGVTATIQAGGSANSLPIRITILGTAATGNRTFTVVTPGGTAASGAVTFAVTIPTPTVSSIVSNTAARSSTTTHTINGTYLSGATSVTFSGSGVTATIIGSTANTVTVSITVTSNAACTARTFTVVASSGTGGSGAVALTVDGASCIVNPPDES